MASYKTRLRSGPELTIEVVRYSAPAHRWMASMLVTAGFDAEDTTEAQERGIAMLGQKLEKILNDLRNL